MGRAHCVPNGELILQKRFLTMARDARTGQCVLVREAGRRPATTVAETVRRGGKK